MLLIQDPFPDWPPRLRNPTMRGSAEAPVKTDKEPTTTVDPMEQVTDAMDGEIVRWLADAKDAKTFVARGEVSAPSGGGEGLASLRPYQRSALEAVEQAGPDNCCVVLPCGAGKTKVGSAIVHSFLAVQRAECLVCVLCLRRWRCVLRLLLLCPSVFDVSACSCSCLLCFVRVLVLCV